MSRKLITSKKYRKHGLDMKILFQSFVLGLFLASCNTPTPPDILPTPTPFPENSSSDIQVITAVAEQENHTWVASPVLMSLETEAGFTSYEYAWSLTPDLILYSDGLLVGTNWEPSWPDYIPTVWQANLSNSEMCDLLYEIESLGFYDFDNKDYEEPGVTDQQTIILSAHTWRTNYISAYALSDYIGNSEPNNRSALVNTYHLLSNFKPANTSAYQPDQVALLVSEAQGEPHTVAVALWPFEDINLAELATKMDRFNTVETLLEGPLAKEIYRQFAGYWTQPFIEDGKIYTVTIRPLFPLEIYEKVTGWGSRAKFEPEPKRTITCHYKESTETEHSTAEPPSTTMTLDSTISFEWITSFGLRNTPGQLDKADLMAISPDDIVWMVDGTNNRIEKFTLSWERLGYLPTPNYWINAIDFFPDGRLVILDAKTNSIKILDTSGQLLQTIENLPQIEKPWSANLFAVGWDQQIYLGSHQGESVIIFDPLSGQVETWIGPEDDPFQDVTDIDVDRQGNLYVTDLRKDRIVKRTLDGQIQIIPVAAPFHIITLSDGSFYVAGINHIVYFAADGTPLKKWSDQDMDIIDVAIASDESLFVLNDKFWANGPAVVRFDKQGRQLASFGDVPLQPGQFESHSAFSVSLVGDVWVMDTGDLRSDEEVITQLVHLGPNQEHLNTFPSLASEPFFCNAYYLAARSDQTVYVADPCKGRITHVGDDGSVLKEWGQRGLGSSEYNLLSDLTLAPDEKSLYAADAGNNRIIQFDLTGTELTIWSGEEFGIGMIKAFDVDKEGTFFLLDSSTNEIVVYSGVENFFRWKFSASGEAVNELAIDPECRYLYVGGSETRLYVFDWLGNFLGYQDFSDSSGTMVDVGPNGWVYRSGGYIEINILLPID
jgi:DNA-binding beta-propeller fold protein YncE